MPAPVGVESWQKPYTTLKLTSLLWVWIATLTTVTIVVMDGGQVPVIDASVG
jgi:hypothetical protein